MSANRFDDVGDESVTRAVTDVHAHASTWASITPAQRAVLLGSVVDDTLAVSREWCAAACRAKGYDPASPEGAEELFSGIGTFIRMAQALRRTMVDLATKGRPNYPGPLWHKPGNRIALGVMPSNNFERILYRGVRAEVWMEPGVSERDVRATQAQSYLSARTPGVSLVLGAGNVASLGPRDALSKLFVEGNVVVLKANPVNDYLVPYWSRALRVLIDAGYLRIVRGDAKVGAYLALHDLVTDVHVTGSDATHDAIVFGVGEEGARRKAANRPNFTKPVSCELGNVSPVIVVPGTWSSKEIAFQAQHVATMLVNNAGFNCLTPRVLVTHAAWRQREEFLDALEAVLRSLPTRRAYYPGARERHDAFLAQHPDAHQLGDERDDALKWTIIRNVDPARRDDVVFNVEAFFALCAESALPASSPAQFVRVATDFCNDVLWGTLCATLLVDPRTVSDPTVGPAIDEAIANLEYGSIGVNVWHALSFAFATTTWGAYPGHSLNDIQSGRGVVGNAYLFSRPQKSVVRGPFVTTPAPAWFATNSKARPIMERLVEFEARPSWAKVVGLLGAALKR